MCRDNKPRGNNMLSIGNATVPNGYFGDTERIILAIKDNGPERPVKLVCLTHTGAYYSAPVSEFRTIAEAQWHVLNHPVMREYFSKVTFDRMY